MDTKDFLSVFVAVQAATLFTQFMPPLHELREKNGVKASHDARPGQLVAVIMALSIGGIASVLADDPAPLIVSGVTAAGLCIVYEWAIRENTAAS